MINISKYKLYTNFNSTVYNYKRVNQFKLLSRNLKASKIIKQYFQKALTNKPLFIYNNKDKITIYLVYYMPYKFKSHKTNNLDRYNLTSLGNYLNQTCYWNIKLELRFVKIYYPYLDANIFAQYIALNSMKYTFNKIWKTLYKRLLLIKYSKSNVYKSCLSNYKSYVTGIKMLINGRLASQKIRPRTAKYITTWGSFKHNSFNSLLNYNMKTFNNNMGAFSVKVWISQKLQQP